MLASKRARVATARTMRGGTVIGFMIGLLSGMTIAVVVAVFITRSPVPFVNKAGRAPDRPVEALTPADAPDPNKPLYSKNRPAIAVESAPAPARQESLSILERLFGRRSADPEPERPAQPEPAAVKGEARARDAASGADARTGEAKPEAIERVSYLLQAGAFRSQSDADGMRAKLALLGFEARVLAAEVNGQTMYRVRVGPYAQLDDMNRARSRLADNGIEASVVRQR